MKPTIESYIFKVLNELEPYLEDLTIVGGICSAFYHKIKERKIPEGLYSQDLDVGTSEQRIRSRERTLDECLKSAELEVKEVPHYRDIFLTKYVPEDDSREEYFEVEFLLPLRGRGDRPKDRVGQLQGEIISEKLRYLDLLLHNSFKATITIREKSFDVLLPNPGTYIIHKLLSSEKRSTFEKTKKDYGYVLNTLELFNNDKDLSWMGKEVGAIYHKDDEWEAWVERALRKLKNGFLQTEELLDYALDRQQLSSRRYAKDLVRNFFVVSNETINDTL